MDRGINLRLCWLARDSGGFRGGANDYAVGAADAAGFGPGGGAFKACVSNGLFGEGRLVERVAMVLWANSASQRMEILL